MKKHIIKSLIIALILMISFANFSLAVDFDKADKFIQKGSEKAAADNISVSEIGEEFSAIWKSLRLIGAGIVIIATAYMGILYMISPPERQAKLKQQLIGLVVSAVVIFGGYYIWKIVTTALDTMTA